MRENFTLFVLRNYRVFYKARRFQKGKTAGRATCRVKEHSVSSAHGSRNRKAQAPAVDPLPSSAESSKPRNAARFARKMTSSSAVRSVRFARVQSIVHLPFDNSIFWGVVLVATHLKAEGTP
jgi:hypothetical protein